MTDTKDKDLFVSGIKAFLDSADIISETSKLEYYANDLYYFDGNMPPSIVLKPKKHKEIEAIIKIANHCQRPVYICGGGMSYTNAYSPTKPDSIMLDLKNLNTIHEINVQNRYIVVDAGCTWKQVAEALLTHNMAVAFPTPLSGSHSTVGGAVSQGVPGEMQGVLGIEVVMGSGQTLKTGAWGAKVNPQPFYRSYGPDTTGLFIGDNGVFGIKTKIALHLKKKLKGSAYGSFNFHSYEALASTMIALSPHDFMVRRTGLDPYETRNIAKVGLADSINIVLKNIKIDESIPKKLKTTKELLRHGVKFLEKANWTLHIKTEGLSDTSAEEAMSIVRKIALTNGSELPAILPKARDLMGFSIRKFLGKDGERWVATSGLFPIDQSVTVATCVQEFFASRQSDLDQHNIQHSYITNFSSYYFLCEPCFYWNDKLEPIHIENLQSTEAKKFSNFNENKSTQLFVKGLREELRRLFQDLGSVHVQIGTFYKFQNAMDPASIELLTALKTITDNKGIINPGKLDNIKPNDLVK